MIEIGAERPQKGALRLLIAHERKGPQDGGVFVNAQPKVLRQLCLKGVAIRGDELV